VRTVLLAFLAAFVAAVSAPAPVTGLAADGPRVAFASGCGDVRVWRPPARVASRLASPRCEVTSTGSGVAGLALAGTRALWLSYTGGNIREWSLWTASTTRPRPRRLRFLARDVDAPAPIVVGDGDSSRLGDLLPYAAGRTVIALRANGSRRFAWVAPGRVAALSALGGELAVAQEGGQVTVLDATGRVLRLERFSGAADAVRITGNGLLVQRGRTLELRAGQSARMFSLLRGVRLADAEGNRALLVGGGLVRLLDLASGQGRVLGRGTAAQLVGGTAFISSGRRVAALALP
jgi:hypothetical protein